MGALTSFRRQPIRKLLFTPFLFVVLFVYITMQYASSVSALEPCQQKLFQENINYFNCAIPCTPDASGGSGTITPGKEVPDDQLPGNDVQSKIWNYLIAQGWTPVQAAGIMGNIAVEGVWDPTNIEDPAGSTKDPAKLRTLTAQNQGYGLFGFTPGASLLTNDPIKWNVSGVKVTDQNFYYISTQLDVVYGFMKNYAGEAVQYQNQAGKGSSPEQAAIAFMNIFENPASAVSHDSRRENAAKKAMNRFGNGAGSSLAQGSNESSPSGQGGTCCNTAAPAGTDSSSTVSNVYILGDSITEASQSAYKQAFTKQSIKLNIDASVSRGIDTPGITGNKLSGLKAINHDQSQIKQADTVVVALGTNGGADAKQIDKTVAAIQSINQNASIYWVDIISVGRSDNFNNTITGPTNQAIRKQASNDGYQVVHWFNKVDPDGNPGQPTKSEKDPNGYISQKDGLGVHPTAAGSKALAGLVLDSVGGGSSQASASNTGPDQCCGTPSGGTITLAGNDHEQQVFNFFTGNMNYTPEQAAGAVGSLMLESSMNPTISNRSGSGAYGIAQWLGSRYTDLQNTEGDNYDTLQGQVHFMQHELKTDYASVNGQMKNAKSYQEAQKIWTFYYEGLSASPDQWFLDKRNTFAKDALQKYGGGGSDTATTGSCSGGNESTSVNVAVQAAKELSSYKLNSVWGGLHGANQLNITDPKKLRKIGADCSGSVSWVLHQAGMLGSNADDSVALESWGQAGKGQEMTVWANSQHAFIEFNVPGLGHYQLNTVQPGSNSSTGTGPLFYKWGPPGGDTSGFTPRHWAGT